MKKNSSLSALHDCFVTILSPDKSFYKLAFIYGLAISLFTLAVPFSVQVLITTMINTALFQSVIILSVVLFSVLMLYGTLTALQYYVMELFKRRFFARIVSEIVLRFLNADREKATKNPQLANRYFEIMTVQHKLPVLITGGFALFLQTLVGLSLTSSYHPALLVFNLLFVFVLYIGWRWFAARSIRGSLALSTEKYRVAQWLQELGAQKADAQTLGQDIHHSDQLIDAYLKARHSYFTPVYRQNIFLLLLYAVSSSSLLCTCGWLVISGEMTIGQLVAAELVLSNIFMGLSKAGEYLSHYYDLCPAVEKLAKFYKIPVIGQDSLHDDDTDIPFDRSGFVSMTKITKPHLTKTIAYILLVGITITTLFLAFTPWIQTSRGVGTITALNPGDRAQSINSLVKGRINKWFVTDGTWVKEGDPIVEIIDNDPQLLARLENERNSIAHKLEVSELAANTAKLNYDRQLKLSEEGLSSRKDYEQALIRWKELKADVAQIRAELNKYEVQLARQHMQLIKAPRDGYVLHITAGGISSQVKEGDTLATFAPKNVQAAAELYVSGRDAPLIHPGRKVRLMFEGWPAIQFSGWPSVAIGTFAGEVVAVDSAISPNGKFRILVKQVEGEPWPDSRFLRLGANAKGWVLLNTVSLGYELWRQMNSFPPVYDTAPTDHADGPDSSTKPKTSEKP